MANDLHRYVPDCKVSLSGQRLAGAADAALSSVEIDLDVDLFGKCVLDFTDAQLELMSGSTFGAGVAVKVEVGFGGAMKALFEGEVVGLEPQFRRDQPVHLRVLCMESLHRLALAAMTRSFNNADDGEVLTTVAQQHGLSAEGPSGTKGHLLQQNVSDAVFIRRLAQKQGHHLRLEGKKLVMGDPPEGGEVVIGPADGLRRLKVRFKAGAQVSEVAVYGYDPQTRQEFVGKAKGAGEAGEGAKSFGASAVLSIAGQEHQPADMATAEKMAKGRMRKLAESHVSARLEMEGNADVVPGASVRLDKLGVKVDGTYRVEHALHVVSKHGFMTRCDLVRTKKKAPPRAPAAAAAAKDERPTTEPQNWVALEMKDDEGHPLAGERFLVTASDGRRIEGALDAAGKARVEGVSPGQCQITFPGRHGLSWRPA